MEVKQQTKFTLYVPGRKATTTRYAVQRTSSSFGSVADFECDLHRRGFIIKNHDTNHDRPPPLMKKCGSCSGLKNRQGFARRQWGSISPTCTTCTRGKAAQEHDRARQGSQCRDATKVATAASFVPPLPRPHQQREFTSPFSLLASPCGSLSKDNRPQPRLHHTTTTTQVPASSGRCPSTDRKMFQLVKDTPHQMRSYRVVAKNVQLRRGPGVNHAAFGHLLQDRRVTSFAQKEVWIRINCDQHAAQHGARWVALRLFKEGNPDLSEDTAAAHKCVFKGCTS